MPRIIPEPRYLSMPARVVGAVAFRSEQHDLADDLLLGPAGDDALRPDRADAGDLAEAVGLLFNQVENSFAEGLNQFLSVDWANAADHPGAEIPLDARQGRGRRRLPI